MAVDHSVVPMKDYVDARIDSLFTLVTLIDRKNDAFNAMVDQKNQLALRAALASEQLARTVALTEIKGVMASHNDLIRKSDKAYADTKREMVTQTEFRPVSDFVERSRQQAITVGKFITIILAVAGLAMTFGFGLASFLR